MKKFLPKILISFIAITILLAPVSPVFEKHNGHPTAKIEINKTHAATISQSFALPTISILSTSAHQFRAQFKITTTEGLDPVDAYNELSGGGVKPEKGILFFIYTKDKEEIAEFSLADLGLSLNISKPTNIFTMTSDPGKIDKLEPEKTYYLTMMIYKNEFFALVEDWSTWDWIWSGFSNMGEQIDENAVKITAEFTTKKTGDLGEAEYTAETTEETGEAMDSSYDLECGITNLGGCIASILYVFWEASAWVARLAGSFLDFFVYYSTNSDSYTSIFITKAWSIIRDIANIFFIIALLYIAIKTILSLNVTNNKKLIGAIVVVALLINFSMFFTEVIIDGSNILAKVFYNQIKSVNENGEALDPGTGGQKSISVGLVRGFNPQNIVKVGAYNQKGGTSMFIFITIMLLFLTLYTAYMFFVVAILFIGRVISLWLAMIFSPLAFASYTVPFNIPGFGYKKWWEDLLKAAFLAPIFIFFLYVIALFSELTKGAFEYASTSSDLIQVIMKTLIPFSIIFILLMQAKKLAVDFSGDLGKALSKFGGMALGFAGGAVMGGAAMLGTGVVGGVASRLAGSEKLQQATKEKGLAGWGARMALRTVNLGQKATFDVRKTAVGGAMARGMGVDFQKSASILGLGPKAGGFKGQIERKVKKAQEESELLKTRMTDEEVRAWSAKKMYEYDARRNEAIKNAGGIEKFNEAEFKKKNGERPKDYQTAEALDNDKLRAFAENIGKTSLIYSLAHTLAKNAAPISKQDVEKAREKYLEDRKVAKTEAEKKQGITFNEEQEELFNKAYAEKRDAYGRKIGEIPTMESMMENRTQNIKMGLATAATVGTGFYAGGLAGGLFGGTVLAGEAMKEAEATRATKAAFAKQIRTIEGLDARIKDLTTALEKNKDLLEGYIKLDENGKPKEDNLVTGDRISGFSVKQDEVEKALANMEFLAKRNDLKLKQLIEKGQEDSEEAKSLQKSIVNNVIETARLNKLKNAIKEMNSIQDKLYNVKKDKSKETTSKTKSTPTTGSYTPPTPPPSTK